MNYPRTVSVSHSKPKYLTLRHSEIHSGFKQLGGFGSLFAISLILSEQKEQLTGRKLGFTEIPAPSF